MALLVQSQACPKCQETRIYSAPHWLLNCRHGVPETGMDSADA